VAGVAFSVDRDVASSGGSNIIWIVKLDKIGDIEWEKSLGRSTEDSVNSIKQTEDDGFILAGGSILSSEDVSVNYKGMDAWVVKLDSRGDIEWEKFLGGSNGDVAHSIEQTRDGGFIMAGYSGSSDGDVSLNQGNLDYWVVKLDNTGQIVWDRSLGGTFSDIANSISQTKDGGFIVAGNVRVSIEDAPLEDGSTDALIIKLDEKGIIEWEKTLGGTFADSANCIRQTKDGGFIVAGSMSSSDEDISENSGLEDFWIIKLDNEGEVDWETTLGGGSSDFARSVVQTEDEGFVVVGVTLSADGDVSQNYGSGDAWIVKLNKKGSIEWEKSIGRSGWDLVESIEHTKDGGFILAGASVSADKDNTSTRSTFDFWIVKLGPENISANVFRHTVNIHNLLCFKNDVVN